MFKKKQEVVDLYRDKEYLDVIIESQKKFPGDPLSELDYLKKNSNVKHYTMRLIQLAQLELCNRPNLHKNMEIYPGLVEYMLRAFCDAIGHMQKDLPEGVYDYILNKSDTFMLECIKHALEHDNKIK